jgi:hypothetical protein
MPEQVINVAADFTRFPAGRYRSDGPYSGERFREDFLIPALVSGATVRVILDGTMGFGSSFLEEAFGGLARDGRFPRDVLLRSLTLESRDGSIVDEIWSYIDEAVG